MGRTEKRELASRLKALSAHLLKWRFQPEKRTKIWEVRFGCKGASCSITSTTTRA